MIDVCDVPDVILLAGVAFGTLYVLDGATGQEHFHIATNLDPVTTPAVGDVDSDGLPEIIAAQGTPFASRLVAFEHDGTPKWVSDGVFVPNAGAAIGIGNFDNAGFPEISSASHYAAYRRDAMVLWIANVSDASGVAAGTAFDFLGDGTAEAMFADEYKLFAFDIHGVPLMNVDRSSGTLIEYPSVADVDNDGSAEILVVSNKNFDNRQLTPTLQVIGDKQDRWIQARRIWNQHTYHVTNVNEDGTIPMVEPRSWSLLNTYRTNAQIEGGSVCAPPIP